MIILLSLVLLIVAGYIIAQKQLWGGDVGFFTVVIGGATLFMALVFWPVSYYSNMAHIQEYSAIKRTIEEARISDLSEVERAALTTTIISVNETLAGARYWNDTVFDIYIPDEFANLEPLK
ncbi:MAG: hypothetical protein HPY66_1689 [Firmicutes bacterium]|nr:hypothetical protein [Bacillota bacterium]